MPRIQPSLFNGFMGESQTPAVLSGPDGCVLESNTAARALLGLAVQAGQIWPCAAARGWPNADMANGLRLWLAADERQSKANNNFLLEASHEMRTPINGILGMAGMLLETPLSPPQMEYAQALREQASALLTSLNGMLDFARLDGARAELERVAFDPVSVMQSAAELLSPKAYETGLEIATIAGRESPPLVLGDEGRLRQVLLTLIGAALRFKTIQGVVLSMRVASRDGANVKLRFEVRAALNGGPAVALPDAAPGAAIVSRLVQMMGGQVSEAHEPGRGLSYVLDVPFLCGEAKGAPYPSLDDLPVIIVTSSAVLSEAIASTLYRAGARPAAAITPEEARAALGREKGVILLDRALAQANAKHFLALGAPVVLMAPQEARSDIAQYMAAGFAGFLVKPLRRRSLLERIAIAAKLDGRAPPPLREAKKPVLADEREIQDDIKADILLAEDNPVNAKIATAMLTSEGHRVQWVEDGEAALAALGEKRFDIVILDMRMPKLDGRGAARAIRAKGGAFAKVPILALTAEAFVEDAANALAAGVNEVLCKPVDRRVLAAAVARWVRQSQTA